MTNWKITQKIDLQKPGEGVWDTRPKILMVPGDSQAHTWEITVLDGGEAADLSGYDIARGYFTRTDGQTVSVSQALSGNTASVTLPAECYALGGALRGVLKLENENGSKVLSLSERMFYVSGNLGEEYIDGGGTLPSVRALADAVEAMQGEITHTDALIESLRGRYTGVTLFDRGEGVDATSLNTAYTLADDYTNYDWLEVHLDVNKFSGNGNEQSHDVIHLDVADIVADGGKATLKTIDAYDYANAEESIMWVDVRLTFSGNTFLVRQATRKYWVGLHTADAAAETEPLSASETDTYGFHFIRLNRIVGFKRVSDDVEIADARIGADNTTYQSVGAAIRGQVGNLKNALTDQSKLSNSGVLLFDITSNDAEMYKGIAYPALTVANLSSAQYLTKKYYFPKADKIRIALRCGTNQSAITFFESDGTAISGVQGRGEIADYVADIPNNTDYVVFSGSILNAPMPYTGELQSALYLDINELKNGFVDVVDFTVTSTSYVRISDLTVLTGQNTNSYVSSEIEIPNDAKKISATLSSLSVEAAFAFYDSEHTAITGIAGRQSNSSSAETYVITIPDNAKYVRVSGWKQVATPPSVVQFIFANKGDLYDEVITLQKRTGNNSNNIKYTAFGDSITAGIGSTGNNKSYAYLLNEIFQFSSFSNRGVSGASFTKQDTTNSIIYTKTSALSDFSGIITVMGGTNDFGNSTGTPLGDVDAIIAKAFNELTAPSTTYDASYTFAEAFRYTIEKLLIDNPDAVIYVLSPINRVNENTANAQGKTLNDYRNCEEKICNSLGVKYIDMRECGISIYNDNSYLNDGLHPNDSGYRRMAAYLVDIIQKMSTEYNYLH